MTAIWRAREYEFSDGPRLSSVMSGLDYKPVISYARLMTTAPDIVGPSTLNNLVHFSLCRCSGCVDHWPGRIPGPVSTVGLSIEYIKCAV